MRMLTIRKPIRQGKNSIRQGHTYRAARREEKKARYRLLKRQPR
jgi:hypothetical protein